MAEISVMPASPQGTLAAGGRLHRLAEHDRSPVTFEVDGRPVAALEGDTLLVAMLASGRTLRRAEFGGGDRAGFCIMGACQDCWVWTAEGGRLRACTTPVGAGLRIVTTSISEDIWPISA